MRALELPRPKDLRRPPSPLPLTLAALLALLVLKLAAFVPAPMPTEVEMAAAPLAEVAPAAAPTPAKPGEVEVGTPDLAAATTSAAAATSPVAGEAAERRTARLIDALLAPAAGGGVEGHRWSSAAEQDPLAAEPFLAERRALARQREALEVRRLAVEVAADRLRGLVEELSALKREIDVRLAELEAGDAERLARLVELYEKMRPKDAARIFDELDFDVLVPLALAMNGRKLAPVVAAMTPEVARKLTGELAERRADASLAAALDGGAR